MSCIVKILIREIGVFRVGFSLNLAVKSDFFSSLIFTSLLYSSLE